MKPKPKLFLLLLVCLHACRSNPAVPDIVVSRVKSIVVERRFQTYDLFTVNMKSNYQCTDKAQVSDWCRSLQGYYDSSWLNQSSCTCTCFTPNFSFVALMQRCIDATEAANFGDCKGQGYFDRRNLLKYPVDLTTQGSKTFSVRNVHNCSLGPDYFAYSYNGFQSKWETENDGFFVLDMQNFQNSFDIQWPNADTNRTLSGRIIRLSITCIRDRANGLLLFTRCILLKAKGPVTYYAPVSSSTSSRYQVVKGSSSSPWSPLSLLTSSSPPPSWSSSLSSSSSPTMSSVSLPLSPSPSLVGNSSTALPELTSSFLSSTQSQTTSLAAFTRGQTLPTSRTKLQSLWPFISDGTANKIASTGIRHPSTSLLVIPIEPSKTTSTTTVSSSSAGGGGSPGKRGTRTSENDNGVVIGAAVGGAVVLGIIAIIIIVFWKRRKAGKSTEKQTKQVKSPVYGTSNEDIQLERPNGDQTISSHAQDDQSMYQGLIIANGHSNGRAVYSSPEDEYDNCTVYQSLEKPRSGTPVYQSLKAGQTEPAHTTGIPNLKPIARYTTLPNATGTPIAKGNGATGIANLKGKTATGVPKSKPGTKGQPSQRLNSTLEPVYNILDGPGSDQGTTPEPPYNVLEGPDTGQDYEATNVDPLYNVLEGPNTTYDSAEIVLENNGAQNGPISGQSPDNNPLYNVLEGPESDQKSLGTGQDPLYNVLEGPDAEKSSLVDHGGPIDEPLYNVLEGPDFCGSNQHAPNKPRPLSGHDNLAYEQTLEMHVPNAALRRPGTQRESVYEALRGRTQDLYEALGQSGDPHSTC